MSAMRLVPFLCLRSRAPVNSIYLQLFYSFFKTLIGQPVTVELKNEMAIKGTLVSVDQFLNFKLDAIKVTDEAAYPHMVTRYIVTLRVFCPLVYVHSYIFTLLQSHEIR